MRVVMWLYLQESFYSLALKSIISISTLILLVLIVAYHALEIQVRERCAVVTVQS